MDIKTDIEKQFNAGFSKEEIYANLIAKGYTQPEIDSNYTVVATDPEIKQKHGTVSGKNIAIGVLFLLIMVWRLSRMQSGGNTFLIIGVITAFILAILYFTKKS